MGCVHGDGQGDEGKALEEKLFDRLWDETVVRIRALKVRIRRDGTLPMDGVVGVGGAASVWGMRKGCWN